MSNNVYMIWCEYDIGQARIVFISEHIAEEWAKKACATLNLDYNDLAKYAFLLIEECKLIESVED